MQIKKEYKMYAGHRNEELDDKCRRPHGHDYKIFMYFNVKRVGSISTLFGDFDSKIEPLLKNDYDHRFMINRHDPLLPYLKQYESESGDDLGLKILDRASSVENVCYELFAEALGFDFDIEKIEVQETRTSTIIYTKEDYEKDEIIFKS